MKQSYAKRQILLRRSRFVAAALAGLGATTAGTLGCAAPPHAGMGSPIPSSPSGGGAAPAPTTAEEPMPGPQDSDGDGVVDAEDGCPYEAGTVEEHHGMRGCPNLGPCLSIVPEAELQIREMVYFAPNTANIAARSKLVLDTIVEALKANPEITLVVSGHRDSTERAEVAKKRATEVHKYLVAHGVSADRLTVIDQGDTRPIRSNATAEGREMNRRVDFDPTVPP